MTLKTMNKSSSVSDEHSKSNNPSQECVSGLYQLYTNLVERRRELHQQKLSILTEEDLLDSETNKIKFHLMRLLETSDTHDFSLNDIKLRLAESAPDVVIYNQAEIPDEFALVHRYINRESLKERLLKGEKVPGAVLSRQKTLEIVLQKQPLIQG